MIAVIVALLVIEIALFVLLYLRNKELQSQLDTLQSQLYRLAKNMDEFSKICVNRHAGYNANRGIDFPNTKR